MDEDIEKIKDALDNSNLINTNKQLYWDLWSVLSKYIVEELNLDK